MPGSSEPPTGGWQFSDAADVEQYVAMRLRDRRTTLGLTQKQVADKAGLAQHQVLRYENGSNRIYVGQLHALAKILDVDVAYFYQGLIPATDVTSPPVCQVPRMRELAEDIAKLPLRHGHALCAVAKFLADPEASDGEDQHQFKLLSIPTEKTDQSAGSTADEAHPMTTPRQGSAGRR